MLDPLVQLVTRVVPLLVLLSAACTTTASPETTALRPADELGRSLVAGEVQDLGGAPVVELLVTVSDDYCVPARTTSNGSFEVARVSTGAQRLVIYGETSARGLYASLVVPIEVSGERSSVGTLRVPKLDERYPLVLDADTTQTIVSVDGLTLTFEAGALRLAPLSEAELRIARVPVQLAPPIVPPEVRLVDLVVLHPIRSTFDPPASLRLPPNPELQLGAALTFHALDYETGLLVAVSGGVVAHDGAPVTNTGEGIPELTWIGVSLDPPDRAQL